MSGMSMDLRVEAVSKTYKVTGTGDSVVALDHVDMTIDRGEFVSLVGPSGCGKSTLLRIMMGLITPSEGGVYHRDELVTSPSSSMAFVFQGAALLPWRTILQNVALAGKLRGDTQRHAEDRAREVLELVGLAGFEDRHPHELSGGMQQRANIARAIGVDSDILLMDEPFGALDAMTRQIMQTELLRITEATGKAVVFVTHALDEAALLSDRVAVMTRRPGRIKEIVDVPFSRPRDESLRRTTEFQDLCAQMWGMIEEEVRDAI